MRYISDSNTPKRIKQIWKFVTEIEYFELAQGYNYGKLETSKRTLNDHISQTRLIILSDVNP